MSTSTTALQPLIQAARVQGISGDATLPDDIRTIIGAADQTKRQLTAEELERICAVSDANALVAVHLQERATALVDQARSCLLREQPELVEPGGVLHPAERATACWRDAGSSSASSSTAMSVAAQTSPTRREWQPCGSCTSR